MADDDYSRVPPPHLLKKFSEQARVDSQKRGHAGYCKTFAKLCIDWALDSQPSPNHRPIRSSDLDVTVALVQQWRKSGPADAAVNNAYECHIATRAAQWGADQELEACCEWLANARNHTLTWNEATNYSANLRDARRPKPPSLKEQALMALEDGDTGPGASLTSNEVEIIRRALESIND